MKINTFASLEAAAFFVAAVNYISVSQWLLPVLASAGISSEASEGSVGEVHVGPTVQNWKTFHGDEVLGAEERQQSDSKLRTTRKRSANSLRWKLYGGNSRLLLSANFIAAVLGLWKLANVFVMCMSKEGPSNVEATAAKAKSSESLSARRSENDDSSRVCHKLGLVSSGGEDTGALGEVPSERRNGGMTEQLVDTLKSLTKGASTAPGIIALVAVVLASAVAGADAAVIRNRVEEAAVTAPKQVDQDPWLTFTGWVWCPPLKRSVCYVDFTHTHTLLFLTQDPSVEHRKVTVHKNNCAVTLYLSMKDIQALKEFGISGSGLYDLALKWVKEFPARSGSYTWDFSVRAPVKTTTAAP